jgi:hypothetical protein
MAQRETRKSCHLGHLAPPSKMGVALNAVPAVCLLVTKADIVCLVYALKGNSRCELAGPKSKLPLIAVRGDRYEIEPSNFHRHGWM